MTSEENKIDKLSQEQQAILELLPMAAIVSDADGKIVFVNAMVEEVFGYGPLELQNSSIDRLVPSKQRLKHPKLRKSYLADPQKRVMGGQDAKEGLPAIRRDGSTFFAEIGLANLETSNGNFVIATIVDVTEQRKLQGEALRSNDELLQFAYVASHDLRAPLRGVEQLAAWMLEDKADPEKVEKHFRLLKGRISRMNGLIDGLLEHSKIGHQNDLKEVQLPTLVSDLYAMASPPDNFQFELECRVPILTTVATAFEKMLRNLIANAIKHHFKPEGGLRVSIDEVATRAVGRQPGESLICEGKFYGQRSLIKVEVEDDGPGIEPRHHQRVFGMFESLKSADEVEGSGMGLALVKKICETYGARLSLLSAPGVGSRFTIFWPKRILLNAPGGEVALARPRNPFAVARKPSVAREPGGADEPEHPVSEGSVRR